MQSLEAPPYDRTMQANTLRAAPRPVGLPQHAIEPADCEVGPSAAYDQEGPTICRAEKARHVPRFNRASRRRRPGFDRFEVTAEFTMVDTQQADAVYFARCPRPLGTLGELAERTQRSIEVPWSPRPVPISSSP